MISFLIMYTRINTINHNTQELLTVLIIFTDNNLKIVDLRIYNCIL